MLNLIYDKKNLYMLTSCVLLIIAVSGFFIANSIHAKDSERIYKRAEVDKILILRDINIGIGMNNKLIFEQINK